MFFPIYPINNESEPLNGFSGSGTAGNARAGHSISLTIASNGSIYLAIGGYSFDSGGGAKKVWRAGG